MKFIEKKVEVYNVYAYCDCGGVFKSGNTCYPTSPPQYPHKCDKCGKTEVFTKIYPALNYKEIE